METIKTYPCKEIDLKNSLLRVGDLINSEGPLLSLFIDFRNNDLYIFDWIDSDEFINRWLIYKVIPEHLNSFLKREISYRELFNETFGTVDLYITDILFSKLSEFDIYKLKLLNSEYKPTEDVYFEKDDAKNYYQIVNTLNKIIFKDSTANKLGMNQFNLGESLRFKSKIFGFLHQNIGTLIKPVFSVTTDNTLDKKFSNKIEEQQNVRESNRLPKKEGLELYSQ